MARGAYSPTKPWQTQNTEKYCAEDVTGLKPYTEAADSDVLRDICLVGERSVSLRRRAVRHAGGIGSATADMSSDKAGERPARRKPKVSCATCIGGG